jgi:hypothetical protein
VTLANLVLAVGTLTGVVGMGVGVMARRASKGAARAEVRRGFLDAVRAYEAALQPYGSAAWDRRLRLSRRATRGAHC